MRSRDSWRVLLMLNCNFSMAPTYFTRNSAHVSDALFPRESTHWINQLESRVGRNGGQREKGDWPELLVESVSRLATVLDLDSPPKLESTDYIGGQRHKRVGLIRFHKEKRSSAIITFICVCRCTLLLVLISLLCELLLLWRFLTFRNIVHHDELHLALQHQHPESSRTTVWHKHTTGLSAQVSKGMMNNWMRTGCIIIAEQPCAWFSC